MSGIHIKRFIDRLNDLQASGAKDFTMSIHEARSLHSDITKLLIDTRNTQESTTSNDVVNVEVKGGSF
jgi:hypothetical protein